jgi:excinuclease ABC subunit A
MGPEGGNRGGLVVAEGTPEEVAAHPDSYTGHFLRPLLEANPAKQPPRRRRRATTPAAGKRTSGRRAGV